MALPIIAAPPPGAQFGVSGSAASNPLRGDILLPSIAGPDQAGLTAAGGGQLAGDFDYAEPVGSPVFLPTGGVFTLVKDYVDSFGSRIQAWLVGTRSQPGGVFEYVHLSSDPYSSANIGTVIQGGTEVGLSGQPQTAAAGSGAHLAVITDTQAYGFLSGNTGVSIPVDPITGQVPTAGNLAGGGVVAPVQPKAVGTDWHAAQVIGEATLAFAVAAAFLIAIADSKLYPLAFGIASLAILYVLMSGHNAGNLSGFLGSHVFPHLKG